MKPPQAEDGWDLTITTVLHLCWLFGTGPSQTGDGFAVIFLGSFLHFPEEWKEKITQVQN
jgi:hypothetical protein